MIAHGANGNTPMTRQELKVWLSDKKWGDVILVCPRCEKIDIHPDNHLDSCDPEAETISREWFYYD